MAIKFFARGLTAFSTAQLLAFIGTAYPATSVGISIIFLGIVAFVISLGFYNWAKGRQLNPHNEAPATIMAAFSGSIILLVFMLITAFAGIYIATGGF